MNTESPQNRAFGSSRLLLLLLLPLIAGLVACGGGGEPVVYPLLAQVYELEDGFLEKVGWQPSVVSDYSRSHGMPQI